MGIFEEIITEIKKERIKSRREVGKIKTRISKKYELKRIPTNAEILEHASDEEKAWLLPLLRKKPIRTISGIAVVAVMARPYPCPHGRCIYCPKGENAPQSYTGREPAAMRAKRAGYDPHLQVQDRLRQLEQVGHAIDKVELIVMGGTFSAQPLGYQEWFVRRCLEAMNRKDSHSLKEAQLINEKAKVRNVGITFETRPDYAKEVHVDKMLELGVTRVELGVQTIYDSIYKKIKRGHKVKDVVEATRILKDAGLKVGYHMMPGLFSNFAQDLQIFRTIFEEAKFKPDVLKIYPTLVMRGTELYRLWKRGEFKPYSDEEAVELITEIKKAMPKWIRTMRIQRDIPSSLIEAGVKKSDLGELVYQRLKEQNWRCRCIKCRDVGHLEYKEGVRVEDEHIEILSEEYQASKGIEHFISAEDTKNDVLIAYLRLRFPSHKAHRKEINENTSLVRELRVLGPVVPIGERLTEAKQHMGLGRVLLQKAEELSAENGMKNILITSAIGTREYYKRFGYKRKGAYMGKNC